MDKKVSVQYYYMISVYLIKYSETYREFKKSDLDYQQGVYLGMPLIFTNFPTGSKQSPHLNYAIFVYFLLGNLWISESSPDIL